MNDERRADTGERGAFGRLLRYYREAAGLSQEALAERAGISPRGLLYLERGARRPYPATLHQLADALALTPSERAALLRAVGRLDPELTGPAPAAGRGHNLPAALSSFIGRAPAQARVRELLAGHRLVTLVGTGGVGKTRLALAVAAGVLAEEPDGVWLVELAALAEPGLVPRAVVDVLRPRKDAGQPLLAALAQHCRGKRLLLVLDNCEHLLAACAALAGVLLRAAPALRILATSREPLRVTGEQTYRVPSLAGPDPQQQLGADLGGEYEAVRLFVARGQEHQPAFALSAGNARGVAEICARLDGIPLAIELAAARVGRMSIDDIVAGLDDRFRLLTGGARDLLPRQQTLQAMLDWSYALLTGPEQILLQRLAVFAGGWTAGAALAVCAGGEVAPAQVLEVLGELVAKSLVQVQETGGPLRYGLLETVRAYGLERLAETGETAVVRDQHLAWCVALAEQAAPELVGPELEVWLGRLEAEHDNLRAALGWAREQGAAEAGLRLAGALWRFWLRQDYFGEGRTWLEWALATGEGSPAVRARVLNAAGTLALEQGDFEREVLLQTEALALWRELEHREGIAYSLDRLAWVASLQCDLDRAVALREECLTLQRGLGDRPGINQSLSHLGFVVSLRGDFGRAMVVSEEALASSRVLGDRREIARSLGTLGTVVGWQGDFNRAVTILEECLALYRELGSRSGTATTLGCLAWVKGQQGDAELAAAQFAESLALQRELGDRRGIARSLGHLGAVVTQQGDYWRARMLLAESLRLSRDLGARDLLADGLEAMAHVLAADGQSRRATLLGGAAEAARERLGMPWSPVVRAHHDQLVQTLRAALGEAPFLAAWAEGWAMTLTEALPVALEAHASD